MKAKVVKPKRNNESNNIEDWSTPYLKKYAKELDDCIHGNQPCYGINDVIRLDHALNELDKRGYDPLSVLVWK